jgi:Lipocalin-like domain
MFRKQLALMTLLCTAAGCVSDNQADHAAYSLVGTWSAQAEETIDSAGRTIASNPATGVLVYTPEGRVAVQIVVLPRPVVPAVPEGPGNVNAWDAEQARKVIETYDAYFGTYEADEVNHTVTHHVQGELRPNLDGAVFRRRYQINGDRLTLRSTDPRETWRVVWKRVR